MRARDAVFQPELDTAAAWRDATDAGLSLVLHEDTLVPDSARDEDPFAGDTVAAARVAAWVAVAEADEEPSGTRRGPARA